jgi:molybdopterin converting factor subunit 1
VITVHIKLFAIARDAAGGRSELKLSMPDHATPRAAMDVLLSKFPALESWKNYVRFAVNYEYVGDDHALSNDDELAIIPPVSGG